VGILGSVARKIFIVVIVVAGAGVKRVFLQQVILINIKKLCLKLSIGTG
jgi:hypothetical protein